MRVLLATDGSPYSEGAARFLTRFDFSAADEILVLHVVAEIPYEDDYRAQVKQFIRRAAPGILRAAADILKPLKAKVITMEEEGYPDSVIMDVSVGAAADLVVMGARGVKGLKAFFLGSSTRSVVINSQKPVLVTKLEGPSGGGPLRLLFATDGSNAARTTADLIAALPLPDDAEVKIISVAGSEASELTRGLALETDEEIQEIMARIRTAEAEKSMKVLRETEDYFRKRFANVMKVIEKGDPAVRILDESEKWKADMVAVGSRGLRGVRGMLGSVSRRILGHAGCSVLVGRKAAAE